MIDPDLRLTYLRLGKPTQLFLSLFMLPERLHWVSTSRDDVCSDFQVTS